MEFDFKCLRRDTAGDSCHDGDNELGNECDGVDDDAEDRLEAEDDEDGQHGCAEHKSDRCY